MKEFIEKLIGRLEEYKTKAYVTGITNDAYEFGACSGMDSAIKIVNKLAEEYKPTTNSDIQEVIDNLEVYTVGRLKNARVHITVEELQNQIDRLEQLAEEYKDSEEQGLLLRLPCKIGDVFFSTISNGPADKCKVSSITIKSDETFKIRLSSGYYRSVFEVTTDDIGKTVFLTKEEAEQALKQKGE